MLCVPCILLFRDSRKFLGLTQKNAFYLHHQIACSLVALLPSFFVHAIRSARQARAAQGSLGVWVLREGKNVFWTRTMWGSEPAMRAYIMTGAHGQVMRSLLNWCDEAAVAHWTQDSMAPPSWIQAHRELLRIGRPSKVNHPSEAQRQYQIPEPQVLPGREVKW